MATAEELTRFLEEGRARFPVSEGESLSLRPKQKEKTEQPGPCSALALSIGLLLFLQGCEGSTPNVPSDQSSQSRDNSSRSGVFIRSAKIVPIPLARSTPLEVQVEADSPSLLPVTFHYQWIVNGVLVAGETSRTFDPSRLKLGDRVSADIIPFTATGQGAPYHVAESIIRNSLPILRAIAIQPNEATIDTLLEVHADVDDVDHDLVSFTYRWRCNDRIVKEGEEAVLDLTGCRVGDHVTVEAVPADLEGVGRSVRSEAVIIENSPPTVTAPPPPMTNLERYEYVVHAKDADGDPLQFRLSAAPSGMTIDQNSGRIVWIIPPGTSGKHTAKIVVEDNRGGSTIQDIELILSPAAGS
ncbi:MAG TPA: Ig-like domain-containing protein [Nitrospira sp.]|nr:Ig-like domain-containing protein [Nitrospira sp.]